MTTPTDVPATVLERAAALDEPVNEAPSTAPSLAELLRTNLEQNLADPSAFESAREQQESEIEPIAELGYPVELPPLGSSGETVNKP